MPSTVKQRRETPGCAPVALIPVSKSYSVIKPASHAAIAARRIEAAALALASARDDEAIGRVIADLYAAAAALRAGNMYSESHTACD